MIQTINQALGAGEVLTSPALRSFFVQKADFPLEISFYTEQMKFLGTAQDIEQGTTYVQGPKEPPLILKVSTVSAQTVEILTSTGTITRDQAEISNLTVQTEHPSVYETLADVTIDGGAGGATGLIYGGDANARKVLVSNLSDYTARLGDATAGETKGVRLFGQSDVLLECGGALYAYVPAGQSITFSLTIMKVA